MSVSENTVIRASGLRKVYDQGKVQVHALRGVDLEIGQGEFIACAGPSGSGKTTLLNLLGCLDSPTEGRIRINGNEVTGFKRSQAAAFRLHNIGFVFQAFNLIPVLTAYENAEFILLLQGVEKSARRHIVVPLLERVGLKDEINRRPHELSGGQQQRVAVVRAIASKPRIVLADEPTANLDSETAEELIHLMLELNREHHITFLFSTHDPLVMQHARRLVQLHDGEVESDEIKESS